MPALPAEPDSSRQSEEGLPPRRAIVAVTIGLLLIVLTALAIRYSEMLTGRYISHGIPPLPAFTAVLVLSLMRAPLRRYAPRLAPTHAQILLIYTMLAIGTILNASYHIRAFLPHLVTLQYGGHDTATLQRYASHLPHWYAPHDAEAVRHYFEGAHDHAIPWHAWLVPLFWWSLFFIALFLGAYSLMTLVQKQWIHHERLTFPLLTVPLAVTSEDWSAYGTRRNRRLLFTLGFGVAAVFNGINILHIFVPSIPSFGFYKSFSEYFPDRPWKPFGSVVMFYMLESIGVGYFMPLEVTFSVWFFYLLNRLVAVAGTAAGYDQPGFPYTLEQCTGGYIAVGLLLIWGVRRTLARGLKRACHIFSGDPETSAEGWAWIGLITCSLFILGFCWAAGFSLTLAAPYFLIIGLFVLVYARIRAETGAPFGFIYPYTMAKGALLNVVSVQGALNWGGTGSFVLFSSMAWLSRHHLPHEHAAYQLDGIKLAEVSRIPRRTLFIALLLAFVVGLLAAYWTHLSAYYAIGSNMAAGGEGTGEFRAKVALQEYQQMASQIASPPNRNVPALLAIFGGFCFVGGLMILRSYLTWCPFHPLGFLIATSNGDSLNCWFPLGVAWLCKAVIIRIGGLAYYRRGIPFFLGLTIGHFFCAGIFWPILSLFIPPEASGAYHLYFGG